MGGREDRVALRARFDGAEDDDEDERGRDREGCECAGDQEYGGACR